MGEKIPSALVFKFRRVKAQLFALSCRVRLRLIILRGISLKIPIGILELLRRNRFGLVLRGIGLKIPIGIFRALRKVLNRIWFGMALRETGFKILTLIGILGAL